MSIKKVIVCLFLPMIVSILFVGQAHAVFFWGTKAMGMGTASVGVADDNHAMEINPAGIAQTQTYSFDINYERREYEIWDFPQWHPDIVEESLQDDEEFDPYGGEFFDNTDNSDIDLDEKEILDVYRISIVDSATLASTAVGMYFTAINFPARTFEEGKGYHVGLTLAGNFADIVYVGGNGKYMQITETEGRFNGDFGVLIKPTEYLGIGIAGHNVFHSNISNYINRDIAVGLSGGLFEYAQIAFDVTKDFDALSDNTWNFAVGAQGMVAGGLALRGGFHWDQVNTTNWYGLGIGWVDKDRGSLAYTFQGDVSNVRNFTHSVNINIRY